MVKLTTVGFDADDTLWHNERFYRLTQERFAELLAPYTNADRLIERLQTSERRNLGHYGFGIKGFVLSMIETAVDVTGGRVPGHVIGTLLEVGQEMLNHPIDLLPHAEEVVREVAATYRIVLVTKGDLLHQERKLARSGLGDFFDAVEIVSDKTTPVYARIFDTHGAGAANAAMVGNSMRSDVLPVIKAGGWGIHVPQELTWTYEMLNAPRSEPRFREIADLSALPALLRDIAHD
ncbi:HAD family hydrolase [Roseovarius sp. SCSIO 43702]|uniref:HAD family hydrolase n=1 Tax=Roseovarius sp. SCSIO 43702 TaxID=2823043 RepID=UPI001C7325C5|nr:HAD family hydrolase [Roseovarius sp. SCSIO 43702]QYX57311.1 HAD family hydrolase [Roseovarius sp. SCSIO 43702]